MSPSPDPVSLVRDHDTKHELGELGITVQSYNGELLNEPWEVFVDNGHAFSAYSCKEKSFHIFLRGVRCQLQVFCIFTKLLSLKSSCWFRSIVDIISLLLV